MQTKFHFSQGHFLMAFVLIVIILSIVKCVHPEITQPNIHLSEAVTPCDTVAEEPEIEDSIIQHARMVDSIMMRPRKPLVLLRPDGKPVRNRIVSVPSFAQAFPDLNDLQLTTARRLGISCIKDRKDAQKHLDKLVYIGDNPFYVVEELTQSVPYLVPRAAVLLNEIARAFTDSLVVKGQPSYKLIVTSVLRTQSDVKRLRRVNCNASENSCHVHGTTFDISYNRFMRILPGGESRIEWVTNAKSILAEVLDDQRKLGTCYVKYEYRQACFHITAR